MAAPTETLRQPSSSLPSVLIKHPERVIMLFAFVPFIILLLFLAERAQLVPWLDEWTSSVVVVRELHEGTLTFSDITAFNVDHRIVVPHLVTLTIAYLTDWNRWVEVGFSVVIITISLLLMYNTYLRQEKNGLALYAVIPFAFIFFSLAQRENWIWGFQKQIFIPSFMICVAAWSLGRWPKTIRAYVICLICSVVASWSFLAGNLLWGVLFIAFWLNGYRRWWLYALWIITAVININLYFSGSMVTSDPNYAAALQDFWFIRYLTAYLGAPFASELNHLGSPFGQLPVSLAQLFGTIGIILLGLNLLYYLFIRKVRWSQFSPWAVLIGYGIGVGLLLSVGRSVDITHALIARYTTFAVIFWIGFMAIVFSNIGHTFEMRDTTNATKATLTIVNILAIGAFSFGYIANAVDSLDTENNRDLIRNCLITRLGASERCQEAGFPAWETDRVSQHYDFLITNQLTAIEQPTLNAQTFVRESPDGKDAPPMYFGDYLIAGESRPVFFQHAESTAAFYLFIPEGETATLSGAIYVDTQFVEQQPEIAQDGVTFVVEVRDATNTVQRLYEGGFDPNTHTEPFPFSVDLEGYDGQVITLLLTTLQREHPSFDWSMWVQPHIEYND